MNLRLLHEKTLVYTRLPAKDRGRLCPANSRSSDAGGDFRAYAKACGKLPKRRPLAAIQNKSLFHALHTSDLCYPENKNWR
jgi:hypothetical protein